MRGKVIGKVTLGFHQISTSTQNPEYEHQFRESTHVLPRLRRNLPHGFILVYFCCDGPGPSPGALVARKLFTRGWIRETGARILGSV